MQSDRLIGHSLCIFSFVSIMCMLLPENPHALTKRNLIFFDKNNPLCIPSSLMIPRTWNPVKAIVSADARTNQAKQGTSRDLVCTSSRKQKLLVRRGASLLKRPLPQNISPAEACYVAMGAVSLLFFHIMRGCLLHWFSFCSNWLIAWALFFEKLVKKSCIWIFQLLWVWMEVLGLENLSYCAWWKRVRFVYIRDGS